MAISFPDNSDIAQGEHYEASNGLTYMKTFSNTYVSVASPVEPPDFDKYVLKAGDDMSGSLNSPRFVGNYALEDLRDPS